MASPLCLVSANGGPFVPTTNGVNVPAGAAITVQLANPAGVASWTLAVVGTDDVSATPAISVSGTGNSQRTFTMPSASSTIRLQSQINSGVDGNNQPVQAYTATFGVYVLLPSGVRLLSTGETYEGDSLHGWIAWANSNARLAGAGGLLPAPPPAPTIYTTSASLGVFSQVALCNTNPHGSFTLTLPGVPFPATGVRVQVSDSGGSFSSSQYLAVAGGGIPILLPTNDPVNGNLQGTLQSVYHMTVAESTYSFIGVPNDPTLGTYWLPVGDGVSAYSAIGGCYVATTPSLLRSLGAFSQWVPANTSLGSFTVTLPGTIFSLQVQTTDTGKSFSTSQYLTVAGSGGVPLLLPTNDPVNGNLRGTLQSVYHMTSPSSSYVWQLVPNDPTLGTYWLPV